MNKLSDTGVYVGREFKIKPVILLPSLPASCNWILSISMGVVTMTWHMPAPQPASISLNTVSPFLLKH